MVTNETEMNSADVSNTTRNRELELRVANSKHATMISQIYIITLHTRTDSAPCTKCLVIHSQHHCYRVEMP